MKVIDFPVREIRRENRELFDLFSGIARAHAVAMVPNFEERERLARLAREHRETAIRLRKDARTLTERAYECDEYAKRIDEQMKALK